MIRNKISRLGIVTAALLLGVMATAEAQFISAPQLKQLRDGSFKMWLIDVRTPREYDSKHIEGAANIHVSALVHKKFPEDAYIVLYDNDLSMSKALRAQQALTDKGVARVHVLHGGISAWMGEGYEISRPAGIVKEGFVDFVTPEDLAKYLQNPRFPVAIIDLRPAEGYQGFNLRDSRSVPVAPMTAEEAANGSPTLAPSLARAVSGMAKNETILLIDGGTRVAEQQAEQLRRQGYKRARYLIGGMTAYQQHIGDANAPRRGMDVTVYDKPPTN